MTPKPGYNLFESDDHKSPDTHQNDSSEPPDSFSLIEEPVEAFELQFDLVEGGGDFGPPLHSFPVISIHRLFNRVQFGL